MQAVLDGIFSEHGLNRPAEGNLIQRAKMAYRLLDFVAYKDSDDLVLTFDNFPGEERVDLPPDDFSCLGVSQVFRAGYD